MELTYVAQKIEDTENGWLVTNNETGEKILVFCNANANTAQDAVNLVIDANTDEESA